MAARSTWRSAGLILVAALAAAAPAHAQRVRGTLVDSMTREPIGGAVVSLTDSGGRFLARSIADSAGHFNLMRLAGTRALHVVRIGYRPRDVTLDPADSVVDVKLRAIPSLLGVVAATGKRICPGEPGNNVALDLWEQARAGLLASVVAREAHPPHLRIRSFRKTMEPIRRRVLQDSIEIKDVVIDRSYVAARPAWAFAEQGYMRESLGGDREYFAPDEGVLLDPTFAATHCLRVVDDRSNDQRIGIGFEAIDDAARDTLVEIGGVLWIDRKKAQLKSLEFQYTHLERYGKGSGGDIEFTILPNGVAMIERWVIRSPILAMDDETPASGVKKSLPPRELRTNVRLIGFRETGGAVGFAVWADGTQWHADLPRVTGVATDLDGKPIAGARVWLRGTRDTAITASDGTFHLPYEFPGIYIILASDSVLAEQGISRTVSKNLGLFQGGDTEVMLPLHPRSEVLPLMCPSNSYKPGTGVLMARVIDAAGAAVPNPQIEVEVDQLIIAGDTLTRRQTRGGEGGEDGRFVICGAAFNRPMVVRAMKGPDGAAVIIDQWKDDVATITLVLRPTPPSA